jgi:hypothetical protein
MSWYTFNFNYEFYSILVVSTVGLEAIYPLLLLLLLFSIFFSFIKALYSIFGINLYIAISSLSYPTPARHNGGPGSALAALERSPDRQISTRILSFLSDGSFTASLIAVAYI